jgi:tetratricopeptide (TPR) repeat protein
MQGDRICPKCGQVIPFGQTSCPVCSSNRSWIWTLERETLLAASFALLAVLFVVTGIAARNYHASEKALAEQWYEKGEAALKAGNPQDAVDDFRTALNYSADNSLYELRLAEALIAVGQRDQAETYLQTLWEREPGDGTINLELARLDARRNDIQDARRFYHDAIFGSWPNDAVTQRRNAHLELVRYLIEKGLVTEADAELISVQANLPESATLYTQVGGLFMQVKDFSHALEIFRQAIELNRKDRQAYLGAGESAFHLGHYLDARSYLLRASEGGKQAEDIAAELAVSESVVSLDPYSTHLSQRERIRRTVQAFNRALARLQDCAKSRGIELPGTPTAGNLQTAYADAVKLEPSVTEAKLLRQVDLSSTVMDQVSSMEEASAAVCGEGTAEDQAILLISRERGAGQP